MKIWIDGYEANVPQRLGSSQVGFELLKHFHKLDKENDYTILLPSPPANDLPEEREGWKYKVLKPSRLWTRLALPIYLNLAKQKPDILFSPTHYSPILAPVKKVMTIFDLSYLHFPQMFNKDDLWKLKNWTKSSVKNADGIITISQFSKNDIEKNYGIRKDKVVVAYPGYDQDVFKPVKDKDQIQKTLDKYGVKAPYVIYTGTIQPRKNLIRLIEAIKKIEELNLVIVGKTTGLGRQGWKFEEILNRPKELKIENRVIFTGFAETKDLPFLFSGAEAFVWPSLWEGFGIPVVEAMACGLPVIVSNVSSLPEVAGKAGLFVDPNSVDQIEQAIRTVTTDKKLREKMSKLSLEQARRFSWTSMANQVLKLFKEVTE